MSVEIFPLSSNRDHENFGSFFRLKLATLWLKFSLSSSSCSSSSPSLSFSAFPLYIRQQIHLIESLQYYVLNFISGLYYRYDSMNILIHGGNCSLEWLLIQISLSLLCNNHSIITLSSSIVIETLRNLLFQEDILTIFGENIHVYDHSSVAFSSNVQFCTYQIDENDHEREGRGGKGVGGGERIEFDCIYPELRQLLKKRIVHQEYITHLYHLLPTIPPTDEFDYLSNILRERFIQQRYSYLITILSETSPFYHEKFITNESTNQPYLNGEILSQHIPPRGINLISLIENNYHISFATGGTSNIMKYVYRLTWEDEENARYLAKGLYSQGIQSTDCIMNCLSAGFWGGMHVYNLAFKYLGCSVIPLGPNFKNSEIIQFIFDLKPKYILAIPSFLLKLSEYLETISQDHEDTSTSSGTGPSPRHTPLIDIYGVITGGEMLYDGIKTKIQKYLHVQKFLSTGYTSNETGAIGFQCPYLPSNHFHIHENMQHVRIHGIMNELVGSESAGGSAGDQRGEIICSNLNRTYMPIIEYSIGDSGIIQKYETTNDNPTNTSSTSSNRNSSRCQCGRTLSILELYGRIDDRIRIGGEDLYTSQIAQIFDKIYGLTFNFTINLTKSPHTLLDQLNIHVERSEIISNSDILKYYSYDPLSSHHSKDKTEQQDDTIPTTTPSSNTDADILHILSDEFKRLLREETGLNWYESSNQEKEICEEGYIEPPILTILSPHELPRNPRTGKIKRINDQRNC